MAMEKLIFLKSVMYGADKIPDKWFEKIPGGFFTPKDKGLKPDLKDGSRGKSNKNRRRPYDDFDDYDDDGYRSEGHRRRHRRGRSSYDGGGDEDDYYLSSDERHRRSNRNARGRRHSTEDDQRGHGGGRRRSDRAERPGSRDPALNPYRRPDLRSRDQKHGRERPQSSGYGSDRSANRQPAGHPATSLKRPYPSNSGPNSPVMQSPNSPNFPPTRTGPLASGYVPYANIYGQDKAPSSRPIHPSSQPASPNPALQTYPATRDIPSVAPAPRGYQQNPFAQEAPTAAAAGAGAAYDGHAGFINKQQDPRWTNGSDPNYSARMYTRYDENNEPNSASPRRSSRRDYSPSYDSYDARPRDRRSRSERRPEQHDESDDSEKYAYIRHAYEGTGGATGRNQEDRDGGPNKKCDCANRRKDGYYSD